MAQQLADLRTFAIPNVLSFERGPGGLLRAAIVTPHAEATVYLHGAHVAHYRPAGQKPLLFMSGKSVFEEGKPLRGGIPICFPWFGPRPGDAKSPLHGFARAVPWMVETAGQSPDKSIFLVLRLESSDATRVIWPFDFELRYRVSVGTTLDLELEVENRSKQVMPFEEALHTYFAVGDVRQVSILGLENTEYLDKTQGMERKREGQEPIRISSETDRVYLGTETTCMIEDPSLGRRITLQKGNSQTTVVWNPWIAKAKAMPDFGDDEWSGMLCIESANANEDALQLDVGQVHSMQVRYASEGR